jgi:hypothetical protein
VVGVPDSKACSSNPTCLSDKIPLLQNQRTSLIDPDTPNKVRTKNNKAGKEMKLVVCPSLDEHLGNVLTVLVFG